MWRNVDIIELIGIYTTALDNTILTAFITTVAELTYVSLQVLGDSNKTHIMKEGSGLCSSLCGCLAPLKNQPIGINEDASLLPSSGNRIEELCSSYRELY